MVLHFCKQHNNTTTLSARLPDRHYCCRTSHCHRGRRVRRSSGTTVIGLVLLQLIMMGQVMRAMKYDRNANVSNAVPVLKLNGKPLNWYRLDDGVMGGQSETHQDSLGGGGETEAETQHLIFKGTINTNGGGFTSIRSNMDPLPSEATGLQIQYRGDGKTYKVLLSDGKGGGPWSGTPSWQIDLPTTKTNDAKEQPYDSAILPFTSFRPSFGGRDASRVETEKFTFDNSHMTQIGLMLSLKLSDGSSNPPETFGTGIFDFQLEVNDIQLVYDNDDKKQAEQK